MKRLSLGVMPVLLGAVGMIAPLFAQRRLPVGRLDRWRRPSVDLDHGGGPAERWGSALRRWARRPDDARGAGLAGRSAVVVLGLAVMVSPAAALVSLWGAVAWRAWSVRAARRRAEAEVIDLLPDVIGLFRVAVGAGCSPTEALTAVARRAPGQACPALSQAVDAFNRGAPLSDAIALLPGQLGEPVRPLVAAWSRSLRDGTPLLATLDQLAIDARRGRRRQADVRARRLPVVLLFPLVLCTLPAFALLTVAPLLLTSFRSLQL